MHLLPSGPQHCCGFKMSSGGAPVAEVNTHNSERDGNVGLEEALCVARGAAFLPLGCCTHGHTPPHGRPVLCHLDSTCDLIRASGPSVQPARSLPNAERSDQQNGEWRISTFICRTSNLCYNCSLLGKQIRSGLHPREVIKSHPVGCWVIWQANSSITKGGLRQFLSQLPFTTHNPEH